MFDLLLTGLVRMLFAVLRLLPHSIVVMVFALIIRLVFLVVPRYRKVMTINIELAFKDKDPAWRADLLNDSISSIARFLGDAVRVPRLDAKWVEQHVDFTKFEEFKELHEGSETGVLIATGHLGSFELLARVAALSGTPLSFVVRNLKLPRFDAWWRSVRELDGNRVISRKGAYRDVISELKEKRDVAMLFDQNVTRNRAVFVDFFDHPAATTRALALAVQQTGAPLIVAGLVYRGSDRYQVLWEQCEIEDVLQSDVSRDEKTQAITARMSKMYEELIKESPAEWFWMHRRWKTTPGEGERSIYECSI